MIEFVEKFNRMFIVEKNLTEKEIEFLAKHNILSQNLLRREKIKKLNKL